MEPPPPPTSRRFRIRVQIYAPQDTYNLSAAPLRQFTIVKTPILPLPDITLQQLCDEVVHRFKAIYPGESIFAIDRSQDSSGSDLYLADRVQDVFEDNEVFRVIKGASIRASVDPHRDRSRSRSRSAQPQSYFGNSVCGNGFPGNRFVGRGKRYLDHSEYEDFPQQEKRQRVSDIDPDRPLRSRERHIVDQGFQSSAEYISNATVIQDSQAGTIDQSHNRDVKCRGQEIPSMSQVVSNELFQDHCPRSADQRFSHPLINSATQLRRTISATSISSSSIDEAVASWSDPHLQQTSSKRSYYHAEHPSEGGRGLSNSTAVTTPLSAAQQANNYSPIVDSKKLRRPSTAANNTKPERQTVSKPLPRLDIYEEIGTDYERPRIKTTPRFASLNIDSITVPVGVSMAKFRLSKTPSSDKSTPHRLTAAATTKQDVEKQEEMARTLEERQRLKHVHEKTVKEAERAERERSLLAAEAAEVAGKELLTREEREKERQVRLKREQIALAEFTVKQAKAKLETGAKRKDAEAQAKVQAEREDEAADKAKREEEAKTKEAEACTEAKREEQERAQRQAQAETERKKTAEAIAKARREEEAQPQKAAEASWKVATERQERLQKEKEIDTMKKRLEEDELKGKELSRSRRENNMKLQEIQASLNERTGRSGSMLSRAVEAYERPLANKTFSDEFASPQASTANPTIPSRRVTCTPFIPRGRPSAVALAAQLSSQAVTSFSQEAPPPDVVIEAQIPLPPIIKRKVSFVKTPPSSGRRSSNTSVTMKQTTLVAPRLGITDVKGTQRPVQKALISNLGSSKVSKGKAKVVEPPEKPPSPAIVISSDEESNSDVSFSEYIDEQDSNIRAVGRPGPDYPRSEIRSPTKEITARSSVTISELPETPQHQSDNSQLSVENIRSKGLALPMTPSQSNAGSLSQTHDSLLVSESARFTQTHGLVQNISVPTFQTASAAKTHDSLQVAKALEQLKPSTQVRNSVLSNHRRLNHKKKNPLDLQGNVEDFPTLEESNVENQATTGDSSEEDTKWASNDMQAQLDEQLLTQSCQSFSSPQQGPNTETENSPLPSPDMDRKLLKTLLAKMPSLRRMTEDAQRTKEADREAAKARGLAKAQKIKDDEARRFRPLGLLSDLSSTSSDSESDEDYQDAPRGPYSGKLSPTSQKSKDGGDRAGKKRSTKTEFGKIAPLFLRK